MASYIVRCGTMRTLHVMNSRQEYSRGTRVIARTNRGLEAGEVLTEATDHAVGQLDNPQGGSIQRAIGGDDENELAKIAARYDEDSDACLRCIRELDLPMDLVDVERLFGGERVIVYYLSEGRVDFRELVKKLAAEFQTRVEMRQIGVRDEAKLLADYGDCGKPVCCNTHLLKMPPVSMKMAKLQKATLDPNKISGRCGRLKCCLRYEYDTYEDNRKTLPKVGADVVTANGKARVLSQELLTAQLVVQMEDNRRVMIHADEVLSVIQRNRKPNRNNRHKSEQGSDGSPQPQEELPQDVGTKEVESQDVKPNAEQSTDGRPTDKKPTDRQTKDRHPRNKQSRDQQPDTQSEQASEA